MNNTEYEELIENLNNIEAIAYGYNINGEVLGMDCSDFEQIMVDSAVAITELMDILAKVTAERDAAISDLKENDVAVRRLQRVLGELRKVERNTQNRFYTPRTNVLEE